MRTRTLSAIALCVLTLAHPACGFLPVAQGASPDTVPRLAIMSAFGGEMERLREEAEISAEPVINGRTYYVGTLAGLNVVMVLSGISMVNAAMTTQTLLDHFAVEGIVFSGIAGGVNPGLGLGDVVIPAQWGEYQEQVFARATPEGWDAGPRSFEFGNFGMMFPWKVRVTRGNGRPDQEERVFWFQVDPEMLKVARRAAAHVNLNRCTPAGDCLEHAPRVMVGGNGVSGPTFVDNAEYRDWVWATFQADALDMESAAVAHVAYVNGVAFIAFRSLSDLAGGGPRQEDVAVFFELVADNASAAVRVFLQEWSER